MEEAHQKFAWIQPKAEKLMPVAASVLVVYVLTQKPQWYEKVKDKVVAITGDASAKAGVYIEMAKLFIASKLNIDLDDEAQAKSLRLLHFLQQLLVFVHSFMERVSLIRRKTNPLWKRILS